MSSNSLDAPAGVVRPVVFFDIQIGETPAGRIKMGMSTCILSHSNIHIHVFDHVLHPPHGRLDWIESH